MGAKVNTEFKLIGCSIGSSSSIGSKCITHAKVRVFTHLKIKSCSYIRGVFLIPDFRTSRLSDFQSADFFAPGCTRGYDDSTPSGLGES